MRLVLVSLLALATSSCGDSGSDDELLVSAAASLTDAFAAVADSFEQANPGVDVVLNLAGSSTLREQILEGSPTDVFASANLSTMQQVVEAGVSLGPPRIFAENRLQIAVPAGNPGGVVGLHDLADEELLVGLCAEGVPCGDFARAALVEAGVDVSVDTNEPDVRSLLSKIEAGELDVGITYVTDVISTDGAVEGLDIPEELQVAAAYPIVALEGAGDTDLAKAFIEFVLSSDGQEIIGEFGFSSP